MKTRILKAAACLPLVFALCQCDKVQSFLKPKAPATKAYDFPLLLKFTPAAEASMNAERGNIQVSTYYYGHAKPQYMANSDELHRIELGYKEVVFSGNARSLKIRSDTIDTTLLPQTTEGQPFVVINVSGLGTDKSPPIQGDPHPFIECESYTGPVKFLQTTPYALNCDIATP